MAITIDCQHGAILSAGWPEGLHAFHTLLEQGIQPLVRKLAAGGVAHRVAGFLERWGLLERDAENSYLVLESGDDDMMQLQGHSITYRIGVAPQQGR
jgi:hypothetical protein